MPNRAKIKVNYYVNRATQILGPVKNVRVSYDVKHEPQVQFDAHHVHYTVNALPYHDDSFGFRVQADLDDQTVIEYELEFTFGLKMATYHLSQAI